MSHAYNCATHLLNVCEHIALLHCMRFCRLSCYLSVYVYSCQKSEMHYLWQMKQLDENLPSHLEEILKESTSDEMAEKLVNDENLLQSDDSSEDDKSILPPIDVQVKEAKNVCFTSIKIVYLPPVSLY